MSIASPGAAVGAPPSERAELARYWLLFLIMGLVSIITGLVAISHALIATLASVIVFGVLLLIEGITEVVHGVIARNSKEFALHLVGAVLYLLVGLFLLEDPVQAAKVITLLLTASFFVGGLMRIIFSVAVRFPAWQWVLLTGVADLILGIILWRNWPEASGVVIGLFVGIDLLLHGWSWVILALNLRTNSAVQAI